MRPKTKKRFTAKIMAGYLALGILGILSGYLIYSEWKAYTLTEKGTLDQEKLLKTNSLLAELYEAESLSKLAQQNPDAERLTSYVDKMDSILKSIDALRPLTEAPMQHLSLDTIQSLLKQKVLNSQELSRLQSRTAKSAPLDSILRAINKMELDMGRITPQTLVPNFEKLPTSTQNAIQEYVRLLNQNIPKTESIEQDIDLDSLLVVSKAMLTKAKSQNSRLEKSLLQAELDMYKTDAELSERLRAVITALEKDIVANAYLENYQKEKALRKSFFLAGTAIFIGLLVAILFTVLVTQDFLKVERLKESVEKEKAYSETILQSREQLINTVSHDIRSPLNTLSGYTDLLLETNTSKKAKSYGKPIKEALGYMERLVNDLLDFSQLEQGKLKLQNDSFTIASVLEPMLSSFKEQHAEKNLEVTCEIEDSLDSPISCDRLRFQQILNNIIGNAFKFTEEGAITISANAMEHNSKSWLKIHVTDSGIGIPKSKLDSIFNEFTQVSNPSEKKYEGYGLGLTISKKLCTLLGGYLEVESSEGRGSRFSITLPLKRNQKIDIFKNPMAKLTNKTHTLLVLDDDETLLQLLTSLCENQGWNIHSFSDFRKVPKTSLISYDVVVTDLQMGDFDGKQVPEFLRNEEYQHYHEQPIIAMTGQIDINSSFLLQKGFADLILKPFSPELFFDTIHKVLHKEPFSLASLKEFVQDEEALTTILLTFLTDTEAHMKLLKSSIQLQDKRTLRSISHKMLPMFRQLQIHQSIPILEAFENYDGDNWTGMKHEFVRLTEAVSLLKKELNAYTVSTRQVDID